jgi:methylmalonyl-CoA mutase
VESLTHDIAQKAWKLIEEVEGLGGMTKAIEAGIPKMRIEEAAARKQARIDSETDIIVGNNKYRLEKEDPLVTLEVDNQTVRLQQVERLERIKKERNAGNVKQALEALTKAAKTEEGNLLGPCRGGCKGKSYLRGNKRCPGGSLRQVQSKNSIF